jgi:hypothetical protein
MIKSVDGGDLADAVTTVRVIKYIKSRPVKIRLYEKLCSESGSQSVIS